MGESDRRVVILSDTHLGRADLGVSSAMALRAIWQGADHLIINGDYAELHDPSCRVQAARQVLAMQAMCERDGVRLTVLSGNHDPLISDRRYLTLCGGEVFITHGDVLHPAITPWCSNHAVMRRYFTEALDKLDEADRQKLEHRLAAAQYASYRDWETVASSAHESSYFLDGSRRYFMQVLRTLWYWQSLPRAAASFASRYVPGCRFFIFGHIHRAGIWRIQGRVIINTGSYHLPPLPRAVVLEEGILSVWPIRGRRDAYRLARLPVAGFEITGRRAA